MAPEPAPTSSPPPDAPAVERARASAIASAVQRRFALLRGSGKPAAHEHTVLAGFVVAVPTAALDHHSANYSVASLATGTKCLGGGRRAAAQEARLSLLHDSHAEALARRGLLLWVHGQLRAALRVWEEEQERNRGHGADPTTTAATTPPTAAPPLCFQWLPARRRFALLPGVELYLYVSQPPCGDASILHDDDDECGGGKKEDEEQKPRGGAPPRSAAPPGSGRTGAKLIATTTPATDANSIPAPPPQIPQAGHVEAAERPQQRGALRRKPGKGDATLSMSCSDKLWRWQALGLQGGLLSSALEQPLRLSGVVVSVLEGGLSLPTNGEEEEEEEGGRRAAAAADAASQVEAALRRAVFDRFRAAIEDAADALRRGGDDGSSSSSSAGDDAAASAAAAERLLLCSALLPPPPPRPSVAMAAPPPPRALGLAPSESRRVPCGVSINWHDDMVGVGSNNNNKAEVTVGAAGCRAGIKPSAAAHDPSATRSRLSRASLALRFVELLDVLEKVDGGPLPLSADEARSEGYSALKRRAAPAYARAWAELLGHGALAGAWLRKPEDVLAVKDYEHPNPFSLGGGGGSGGGDVAATAEGRGGRGAVEREGAACPKRPRTDGAASP